MEIKMKNFIIGTLISVLSVSNVFAKDQISSTETAIINGLIYQKESNLWGLTQKGIKKAVQILQRVH